MTFLSPTRGELLDRLSIVARRAVECWLGDLAATNDAARQEGHALTAALVPGSSDDRLKFWAAAELAATNAALWERENLLRAEEIPELVAKLAREIARLNDERSRLIALIDGVQSPKIHRV